MIKALFFDLDGTLLTSSKKISDNTKSVLRNCREKGIKIFTATARPPFISKMLDLSPEEDELLQDGGIFYNGGCIRLESEKLYTFLDEEAVRKCIKILENCTEVNFALQSKDELHSFRHNLTDEEYKMWGVGTDGIISYKSLKYNNVVKIMAFFPWDKLQALREQLIFEIGDSANIYLTGRKDFKSIEIVSNKINKKLAIDKIIELCEFEPDQIAVFGDDNNDMEMLSGFKHSFAMGNACNEVKSTARYITLGNDQDGIPHAIKNILKIL